MVGKLLSFWDGLFSGTMLNLEGVDIMLYIRIPFSKMPGHLVKLTSPNNATFLQETAAGWPVDTPLVQSLDPGEKMWPKMLQKKKLEDYVEIVSEILSETFEIWQYFFDWVPSLEIMIIKHLLDYHQLALVANQKHSGNHYLQHPQNQPSFAVQHWWNIWA